MKPPTVNLALTAYTFTTTITSDKNGRVLRTEVMGTNGAGYSVVPTYNAQGHVTDESTCDGPVRFHDVNALDAKGHVAETKCFANRFDMSARVPPRPMSC